MSQNVQTDFKNLARFLKCVWAFYGITKKRVKNETRSVGFQGSANLFYQIISLVVGQSSLSLKISFNFKRFWGSFRDKFHKFSEEFFELNLKMVVSYPSLHSCIFCMRKHLNRRHLHVNTNKQDYATIYRIQ